MTSNPTQLLLLSDHIKLSLLERQRAISLNLEPNSQDSQISRSLDTFREGLDALSTERTRLEALNDPSLPNLVDQEARLKSQYDDLTSQFHGFPLSSASTTRTSHNQPNDPSLTPEFNHAKTLPSSTHHIRKPSSPKTVRFTDAPSDADDDNDPTRNQLFPYTDSPPDPNAPDPASLSNPQLLQHHAEILSEQDAQLDTLGESISRQRELSIQIGDELDDHVRLLDEVDEHVDRHQSRLDLARRRLGGVARRASGNKGGWTILVLILVLVVLVAIFKS